MLAGCTCTVVLLLVAIAAVRRPQAAAKCAHLSNLLELGEPSLATNDSKCNGWPGVKTGSAKHTELFTAPVGA